MNWGLNSKLNRLVDTFPFPLPRLFYSRRGNPPRGNLDSLGIGLSQSGLVRMYLYYYCTRITIVTCHLYFVSRVFIMGIYVFDSLLALVLCHRYSRSLGV